MEENYLTNYCYQIIFNFSTTPMHIKIKNVCVYNFFVNHLNPIILYAVITATSLNCIMYIQFVVIKGTRVDNDINSTEITFYCKNTNVV